MLRILCRRRDPEERALLMIKTLFQLSGSAGSESDAQRAKIKFEVRTARTERLCFPRPGGDHASVVTVALACSSPMDISSKLACSCQGHSSVVNLLTVMRACVQGSGLPFRGMRRYTSSPAATASSPSRDQARQSWDEGCTGMWARGSMGIKVLNTSFY